MFFLSFCLCIFAMVYRTRKKFLKCQLLSISIWCYYPPTPTYSIYLYVGFLLLLHGPVLLAVEGLWLWMLTLVTGDRWHMTRDNLKLTTDTWRRKNFLSLSFCLFGIGATIRTHQEIKFLLYAFVFIIPFFSFCFFVAKNMLGQISKQEKY